MEERKQNSEKAERKWKCNYG